MSLLSSSSENALDAETDIPKVDALHLQPKENIYEPLSYSSDPAIVNLCSQISTLNENNRRLLDQRCNEVSNR